MSHVLDSIVVLDPEGRPVRLGALWADRTAVLVFVRHFGCLFCRQQMTGISPFVERIRACGAELIVIGSGTIDEARAFRDEQHADFVLLTDPGRQAYRAMDMRRGIGSMLGLSVLMRSLEALKEGFRQSRVAGDPLQQGGVVVIAPGGVERFRFISRHAGDHPPPADILSAL